jgi:hypothetical protein
VVMSVPAMSGRGFGVVAAAAVADDAAAAIEPPTQQGQPPQQQPAEDTQAPAYQAASRSASPPANTSCGSNNDDASLLAVQCGPGVVLQLSFQELQQLCGQQSDLADVADAPAEAAGVSTRTGVAAAAAGGMQGGARGHSTVSRAPSCCLMQGYNKHTSCIMLAVGADMMHHQYRIKQLASDCCDPQTVQALKCNCTSAQCSL